MAALTTSIERAERQVDEELTSARPAHATHEAQTTHSNRLAPHLLTPIRNDRVIELELLLLTFCTGVQDAISFPDYHCFALNQSGNTVLIALAFTVPRVTGELIVTANVGVSLCLFLAGGYITGQIGHHTAATDSGCCVLMPCRPR